MVIFFKTLERFKLKNYAWPLVSRYCPYLKTVSEALFKMKRWGRTYLPISNVVKRAIIKDTNQNDYWATATEEWQSRIFGVISTEASS